MSDRAVDVVDGLVRFASRQGVRCVHGRAQSIRTCGIANGETGFAVMTQEGEEQFARAVILATGGASYPATGSTGDGYSIARELGHTVVKPEPSLVPVEVKEGFCSQLQGLSLKNVTLTVEDVEKKRTVFQELGELMFAHYGLSGPLALSASAHMQPMREGRYVLHIDCKPGLTPEQLDARLTRDLAQNLNRDFINSLSALLPKSLIPVAVRLSRVPAGARSAIKSPEPCGSSFAL